MRLFIGTFLNKELVEKIRFESLQELFEGDLKHIKKENIHMTWIFLRNVEENRQLDLKETIDKHIEIFKGVIFQSTSLEFWPPKRQPRLIVLTGKLNKEINLVDLSNDLENICKPDIKDDFLPHITILRFKKDKTVDKKIALPKVDSFTWQINEISLIQSSLSSEGSTYNKIYSWNL